MYEKLIVDTESPSGLRWVSGRNKGKPAGYVQYHTKSKRPRAWYVKYEGKLVLAHRVIYELIHGSIPDGMLIDHIDQDPTNNHPDNLRLATHSQNACNLLKGGRPLPKGITKRPASYMAYVQAMGKPVTKNFKKLDDAIEWLKEKRRELHGEFACN